MKRLITHPRPHLDDICAIWFIKRFLPGWNDAAVEFASATSPNQEDDDTLMIGIGRGKFDEHKGDVGESATSLVWKHIRSEVPNMDETDRAALDHLSEWVRKADTSTHDPLVLTEHGPWLPPEQLRAYFRLHGSDSGTLTTFGEQLCDLAFTTYKNDVRLERDWEQRQEFDTPWGKGVGLTTDVHGADDYAYSKGFVLMVYVHPKNGHRGYRGAAKSDVDLSATAAALSEREPQASWFLHHTKKLLLSGSDVAPEMILSELSLQDLMGAIR